MATLLSALETQVRRHINETTASFWSSAEIIDELNAGIKDLWRDTVDLKGEHFLTVDNSNVSLVSNSSTLTGVPNDVHKIYLIEPRDISSTSANRNLYFQPLDYNNSRFRAAAAQADIDPTNAVVYYAMVGQGAPTTDSDPDTLSIYVAPQVTSSVNLSFVYVPTIGDFTATDYNPIPGESNNALVAWGVAYARAKEREDRSPDPSWLQVYSTEKQHLLHSLGLRQLQENVFADALFEDLW